MVNSIPEQKDLIIKRILELCNNDFMFVILFMQSLLINSSPTEKEKIKYTDIISSLNIKTNGKYINNR